MTSGTDDTKPVTLSPEAIVAAPPDLKAGDRVGEYRIDGLIASGGCGSVFAATHRVLGRRAAIKVLLPEIASSQQMFVRFLREARITNQLRHPHIVDIYDFGEAPDGRPFYVMELLDGTNLSLLVREGGRLDALTALAYFTPVCEALAAAHAHGIVHRDIKGSNIHIPADRDPRKVKLLDFGIAKLLQLEPGEGSLTQLGQRLGTVHTCAPEQLQGLPVDGRADVYALGVTLYFALVGKYPFPPTEPLQIERFHLLTPFPRPSAAAPVAAAVDEVVLKATQKNAAERFQTATEFLEAFRAAASAAAPPASAPVQGAPALGIHVEVAVAADASDSVLDAAADVLDEVELTLSNSGFRGRPVTAYSVVGVQLLPDDPRLVDAALARAEELARTLFALQGRLAGGAGIGLNVCVTVSRAEYRGGPGGIELVGGEVFNTERWVVRQPVGLHLTGAR